MRVSALALVATIATATPLMAQSSASLARATADTPPYVPRYELPKGRQLVVAYIGGSEAMRTKEFVDAVRAMKPLVARQASERGLPLAIIGVSLDWEVDRGIANLQSMGAWDELVVGNNWINVGAQHFLWQRPDSKPDTPQVIVLERAITPRDSTIEFGPERRLAGYAGLGEIVEWVRRGAPLPAETKQ
jgi:hypothetical protein